MVEGRLTFWDYLSAVVNRRLFIFIVVFLVMLLSVVIASYMPRWYRAKALILPPEERSDFAGMIGGSGLAGIAASAGSFALPVLASESDVMASMLRSRTVLDAVVDSFDLVKVYGASSRERARSYVASNLDLNVGADGVIKLEYIDTDRQRCANIANAIIKTMDWLRSELAVQRARSTRLFIEKKLAETRADIAEAEDSLTAFQRKYKIVAPQEQANASVKAAADLRAQMILKEIELSSLRATHSEDHPSVVLMKNTLAEMSAKIDELENGMAGVSDTNDQYLSIPFSNVPDLILRYGQLSRNLKIQEEVFEVLTQQYEHAKIQESKETPTVSVLDWAVPPVYKYKPKRARIGITAGFLTFVALLVLIFIQEYWKTQREVESATYKNLSNIMTTLRRDLFGFRGRKATEGND